MVRYVNSLESDVFEFDEEDSDTFVSLEESREEKIPARPVKISIATDEDLKTAEDILDTVQLAFTKRVSPELICEGSGGAYFLFDEHFSRIAVFKPADEEAFAPNNPRGHIGEIGTPGLRQGIRSGEAAAREAAAYLLDSSNGHYSGVPFTTLADIEHPEFHLNGRNMFSGPKRGSLQEFVKHDDVAGNLSAKTFPISEVHKIGILDIRLVNTDRNDGNILIQVDKFFKDPEKPRKNSSVPFRPRSLQKASLARELIRDSETRSRSNTSVQQEMRLVPIDHGYSLPDILEIAWCDWVWMNWPQAKIPFDRETREFIEKIDIDRDVKQIKKHLSIREECLINLRITSMLLKKGAKQGLSLYQIAKIIARDNLNAPSLLEIIVAHARVLARKSVDLMKRQPKLQVLSLNRSMSHRTFSQAKSPDNLDVDGAEYMSSLRRNSFTYPEDSESGEKAQYNQEFFEFLECLMDDLIDRKTKGMKSSRRTKHAREVDASRVNCSVASSPMFIQGSASETPTKFSQPNQKFGSIEDEQEFTSMSF